MTATRLAAPRVSPSIVSACFFLLFLVIPFEPRWTLPLGPIHVSLVEAVALIVFMVLFVARSERTRVPNRPVLGLLALFGVSVVSALLTETEAARAFKFALRIGAMATFAWLVSGFDDRRLRSALQGLMVAGTVAAFLAVLEGLGVRSLDLVLGAFRETPFNVAGVRRATAGSEYPNLGAAMIVYALLAGVVLMKSKPWVRALFVAFTAAGLAFTFSRGAWIAGLVGLIVIVMYERGPGRFVPATIYASVVLLFLFRVEISQLRLEGENANDFYAATYAAQTEFALEPSERIVVPVTITNTGRRPWRKGEEIHLSYHLYASDQRPLIDGPRTDLPRDVMTGDSVVVETILRAPARPGRYLLLWDLVHEDTTWFSGQGVRPGMARLTVGADVVSLGDDQAFESRALKAIPESLAWRPSRLELWRLALRMWMSRPMLGVGPDNFRWTYGVVAGKPAFDTRVFANNMYLENAATLGTLGLAAFLVSVFVSLSAGLTTARVSEVSLAALAILATIAVHGMADYLLAFTGHYLMFGWVIGVLARSRVQPGELSS